MPSAQTPSGAAPRHRRCLGVCACLIGVAMGLALAESVLQALGAVQEFRTYSASRGWRLRPGAAGWQSREGLAYVAINPDGRRGPRVTPRKPPGTLRIAVLGDSFVEAVHVPYEHSVCAVLQRELEQHCPAASRRHVEVLNFGVSGYGTAQELLTLREEVWQYDPDVVVLAIFTGNDLSDNSSSLDSGSYFNGERCRPYFRFAPGHRGLDAAFTGGALQSLYCRLNFGARGIALLRLMGTAARVAQLRAEQWQHTPHTIPGAEPGIDDRIYAPPNDEVWRDAWDITERLIVTMAREVTAKGARFLAVTLSNPVQVYPEPSYRQRYLTAVGGTDFFYPEHRLHRLGVQAGFEILTLAPAMQRDADRERLCFHGFAETGLGIGHWNARGHAFAGQAMGRTLCTPEAP